MANLQPLSHARHGALGWQPVAPPVIVDHGVDVLPVVLSELVRLVSRMPVVIGLAGRAAEPVIPLGAFDRRAGAIVDSAGYWQPAVVPRALRPGPFGPVSSPEGEIAMVDERALRPLGTKGTGVVPIFEDEATLTARTRQEIAEALAWKQGRAEAKAAARGLEAAGCLRDLRLGHLSVRVVDEERLARAGGETLDALHRVGSLRLAHMSVVSLGTLVTEVGARRQPTSASASETSSFLAAMREALE